MRQLPGWSARSRQQGAVLYISLILLIILTIIGVAAARLQTGEAVMARNDHNHQLAMQYAEAALRDAEINLADGIWSIPQFAANAGGLYVLQTEVQGGLPSCLTGCSIADTVNWTPANPAAMPYSGAVLANAPASTVQTQVIIENLPPVARAGDPLCTPSSQTQSCSVYRVTAHAVGGDASASATLQSIIH
ncbi:MAG TPA: PilX N-terminal domain-containing pilus assembly protein [Steroidobacteraceae bacterium]|nr:PilX N-terminal domain-containing pilus assembly protein [Steroidobacteraceae bacterium]